MARRFSLPLLFLILALGEVNACRGAVQDDEAPLPEFAIARLGTSRFRHNLRYGSGFASLAFSPDGAMLAATCDKGLALWDAATGKPVSWFPPSALIKAAAFTPDGKKLITFGHAPPPQPRDFRKEMRRLQHWEVGAGKLLQQIEFERTRVYPSSEFPHVSPDGKFFVHTNGKEVVVWDAMACKIHASVPEKVTYWSPIALSRDATTLAVVRDGLTENELNIYDLPDAKLRHRIFRERTAHYAPAFSPDGKFLVTAARDSLLVYDPESGKLIREIPNMRGMVAFSADGKQMACADRKGIQLYALPAFTEVRRFDEMRESVYAIAFSPDGKRLASGHDQTVVLWDVATGKQSNAPDGHQSAVCALAFSADGKTLASGSDGDGVACIWDVAKRQVRTRLTGHLRAAASVAISADGKMLASGDGSPTYQTGGGETHIRLWDLESSKLLRKFPAHLNGVTSLDFAPDGKTLVSGGLDARVRLWNVADGARLGQVRGGDAHHWGQFSRDGKQLLVADGSGALSIWNSDLKQKHHDLLKPEVHGRRIELAAHSADGKRVIAANSGSGRKQPTILRQWETATGNSRVTEDTGISMLAVRRCALSPEGRILATLSAIVGGHVELWDTDTRTLLGRLPEHTWYINTMAFSPDGQTLATASMETTIMLWDVRKATKK